MTAAFPSELFLTLVGVCLLFTQAEVNGTLARVAAAAQRLCRGNRGLILAMFFVLAFGVGTAGPGNIAIAGLIAPLAMAAASRAGIPPLLMAQMVGHGAIACTLSPFTAAGVVANQILGGMSLDGHEWRIYASNAVANAAAAFGGLLLFGGWKLIRQKTADQSQGVGRPIDMDAVVSHSLPFSPRHWITLAVIAALIVAVAVGKAHIGLAAFAGAAVLSVLRLADERETLQKVPWSVILMVCGVSTLAALLDRTGGTRRFAELIGMISTTATLSGVVAFVAGIVSIYSSTTGVVLPAFLPLVKDLAAVHPESDPLGLAISVLIGGNLVDMSPLSTIGALCLAAAPAGIDRRVLFNQLLAWGFAMSVAGAIVCWALWGGS